MSPPKMPGKYNDEYDLATKYVELAHELAEEAKISHCAAFNLINIMEGVNAPREIDHKMQTALRMATLMVCLNTTYAGAMGEESLY
jgi:hypothetical protein